MKNKIKICLTGGIASGKTFVSDRLADLGAYIIDADILAREVVKKGSQGLSRVVSQFGPSVLSDTGGLDRGELKKIVFNDKDKLIQLNNIIHPLVRKAFVEQSNCNLSEIEIWVIPLYRKGDDYQLFDRTLVVDVSTEIQLQRVLKRDGVSVNLAKEIIKSQPTRLERLDLATDVISNRYSLFELETNVDQIFNLFQKLSVN